MRRLAEIGTEVVQDPLFLIDGDRFPGRGGLASTWGPARQKPLVAVQVASGRAGGGWRSTPN